MGKILRVLILLAAALLSLSAGAQSYPARPVKIVVPYPPGGATDVIARIVAERLQSAMGQPFIVENRSGAGGFIGTEFVSKAAPDGYTLLLTSSPPIAVGLKLYKKVPYDVVRDFAPIATVAEYTVVFAASNAFKPQSVKEVIAYAEANPGKLNFGLNSVGSIHHLLTELFRLRTKTKINIIPYRGSGPLVIDLLSGVVDVDFDNLPVFNEYIRSNRLRALAVASAKRSELLPDVPTLVELGLPDLVASPWNMMLAPAGTPAEIISRMNEEVNKVLRAPGTIALLAKQGIVPIPNTVEHARNFLNQEIEKWGAVVVEAGVKLE